MATLVELLTARVREAAVAAGFDGALIDPVAATRNPEHGDYQSNSSFKLAKVARTNPRQVATAIAEKLSADDMIAGVEVAGAGFLNLRMSEAFIARQLKAQLDDPGLGVPQQSGTVIIDYSSPNVAKRMHVGHLRSTIIGNALDRMHRFAGYTVIADNHIGDWGTQFGQLTVAWRLWANEADFEADPIEELNRIYVKFHVEAETNPALEDAAREQIVKLQAGEPENLALWRRFIDASLREFNAIYGRLDVHFDVVHGESHYAPMLVGLVDELLASGKAQHSDGAVIVSFDESTGLGDKPMLIRKRDGAALYATSDLAAVRYRLDTWNPARILYVTDTRQQLHFRQVFTASKALGWDSAELVHVWFGLLSLPEGAMATRKGNVINLIDVLDEAVSRARKLVDEKSPALDEDERAAVAEAVGIGAVRYADLSQNPQSNVTFEWDRMLSLDGNTAPFLMYSYARCRNIQAKGNIEDRSLSAAPPTHPLEHELAGALLRFPEAFASSLANYRPNILCDYLFNLATLFNRFYYELPVLRSEGAERAARLDLVEATARVLGAGMGLVGIRPLERM